VTAAWVSAWVAVIVMAIWLSQLAPMWLAFGALGSLIWTISAIRSRDRALIVTSAALWLTLCVAGGFQLRLNEIGGAWDSLQPRVEEPLAAALGSALDGLVEQGEQAATGAAEAADSLSSERSALFDRLAEIRRVSGLTAVALFDPAGNAIAWAGEHRGSVPLAARTGTLSYLYQEGPLFSYLYFVRPLPDGYTATAAILLEASVDAGEGVVPFADRFEQQHGARPRFWTPDRERPESIWDWATDDRPILSVSFSSLTQQDWWLRTADLARKVTGGLLLALFIGLTIGWYRSRGSASGVPLVVLTLVLLLAPLDTMLGAEALFSPLQFVLPGPLDVNLGALLIVLFGSAVWLLAYPRVDPDRNLPGWASVALAALLFPLAIGLIGRSANDGLLAARAAGGFPLQLGSTLLIAIPLFLILERSSPRVPVDRSKAIVRVLAFVLPAAFGIVLILLWVPGSPMPLALSALWAMPAAMWMSSRSDSRGPRGILRQWLIAAWLAGTATLAFLWPMHLRADLNRAERELALLGTQADPFLDYLLRQFAERASRLTLEGEGGVNLLYHSWEESGLAREGYDARLGLWRQASPFADLNLSELDSLPGAVQADILSARDGPAVVHYGGLHGLHYLMSAPLPDGLNVSVAIPPRVRLGAEGSLARFLHPGQDPLAGRRSETLQLIPTVLFEPGGLGGDGDLAEPSTVVWSRTAQGWRSETEVMMPEGPVHAHLLLATAPVPLLLARGALVLTAILGTFALIWFVARLICRDYDPRLLLRLRWLQSFRGRLSVALFVFFLLPTVAFAAVSYGAVAREVVRSAAALAQQALDQAAASFSRSDLSDLATPIRTDLLLYRSGTLVATTAPEVLELGLFHTWLPPAVTLRFADGEETQDLEERSVAGSDYLVAYRRLDQATVLAAPIPLAANEITMRRLEFRDIALLVILAGLCLSVFLALLVGRALSRPLDELSRAAITVGAGNLATRLPEFRPDEFGSVYHSFNQMVARLDETRAALVQETRRTETIVAEAATGVLALDASGRVELINPRAAEILGGTVGIGDPLLSADFSDGSLSAAVTELLRSPTPELGKEIEFEGSVVRMKLRRLTGDNGGGGVVIALEDVTAELRTARVLAWGEMARQVAHEIKNPLTPIKLAVQHLRRSFHDARPDFGQILDRNVESILREIDRLGEISRAFSRFGTPAAVGSPLEEVNVSRVIDEILALYRGSESGATVRVECNADLPLVVARTGELKEVLLNLLENAREATDDLGAIVVSASVEAPDRVVVVVQDSGVGIPPEQLPSIFEPHFSTRSSGTGLGLAIVRRIVDSWGAQIGVESTPGVGSRFEIRVRAVPPEQGRVETASG